MNDNIKMKFILFASVIAYTLALTPAFGSTAVTATSTYTTGTKLNATCGITIGVSGTLADLTAT